MAQMAVSIRYGGAVVEHRTLRLREGLVLGDARGATVSFPGFVFVVGRDANGWTLSGHRLVVDRSLVFGADGFEVAIEIDHEVGPAWVPRSGVDLRMLVATLALVLLGAWAETAQRVVRDKPQVAAAVQAWMMPWAGPAETSPGPPGVRETEGPRWRAPVRVRLADDTGTAP